MTRRPLVAAAVCGLVVAGGASDAAAAQSHRNDRALAHVARRLARLIRHDARLGKGDGLRVARTSECCGRRVLTVYSTAGPGESAAYGGYELRLTTAGRTVVAVVIIASPTLAPYAAGGPLGEAAFELAIVHSGSTHGWRGDLAYAWITCRYTPQPPIPGEPRSCLGYSSERTLGPPVPHSFIRRLASQAARVIERARDHAPIVPMAPPL